MGYNPIKASEHAFKDIMNHTLNRIISCNNNSLKEIKKDGSILLTYLNDHFERGQLDPKGQIKHYLQSYIRYFTQNLETKKVLETIINSLDLSVLKREGWLTNELKHRKKLDEIKRLADTIYDNIAVRFQDTEHYQKLEKIANELYDNSQKQFETWQNNIDELKKEGVIKPAKPYVLAKEIYDIGVNAVENKDLNKYKEALRALLYLDEKYVGKKISKLINELASADVRSMRCKHKRTFLENLKEIVETHSFAA